MKKIRDILFVFIVFVMVLFCGRSSVEAANTIKDLNFVINNSAYNTGRIDTSAFSKKQWQNGQTFSGEYTFVKTEGKILGHSAFNVNSFSGSIHGLSLNGLTAKAGCTIWGAAEWPASAKGKRGTYHATVFKNGNNVKVGFVLAPPNKLTMANANSGSGYQNASFYFEFLEVPQKGRVRCIKNDKRGGLITASKASFTFFNSSSQNVGTISTIDGMVTSIELPVGRYTVKETNAPSGYSIDIKDGQTVDINAGVVTDLTFVNSVVLGKYKVKKSSSLNKLGDSTIEGAKYTLYANVDILDPKNNELLWSKDSVISIKNNLGDIGEKSVNSNGEVEWNNLPKGQYYAKETKAPHGHLINNSKLEVFTFNGNENDYKEFTVNTIDTGIEKEFYVYKTDMNTNPLANAYFEIKLKSDVNKLGFDKAESYGTLISTANGKSNKVKLPIGEYIIRETKAPQGYEIHTKEKVVKITEDSKDVFITFKDIRKKVELKTNAIDSVTKTNEGLVNEKVTIIDNVTYTHLLIGKNYTIKGKLYDKETGKALLIDNKEVTSEKPFIADKENGSIQLEFTFNASSLKGKSIVVFEDMYEEGKLIASHNDINDNNQTIKYPHIKTSAKDDRTNNANGISDHKVIIIDTVNYSNLIVGNKYTIKGKLYIKEENKPLIINDKEVISEKSFIADKENGSIDLTFSFDASSLKSKSVVVFEDLYHKDIKLVSHNDINDLNQTISYCDIKTLASDKVSNSHRGVVSKETVIEDKVKYTNLIVGNKYTIKGMLYDKETGKPFNNITSSKTFIASKKDGEVSLLFKFDSSLLVGKSVVVFEDLYYNDIKLVSHNDINDSSQTVTFPLKAYVVINKLDKRKNILLKNAYLDIRDSKGEVIHSFISDGKSYTIKLNIGETYSLVETKAPKGYKKASDIVFTVKDDFNNVNTVNMYDEKINKVRTGDYSYIISYVFLSIVSFIILLKIIFIHVKSEK